MASSHVNTLLRLTYQRCISRLLPINARHCCSRAYYVKQSIRCYSTECPGDESPVNNSKISSRAENENATSENSELTDVHKRDPLHVFIKSDVQQLLSNMTGFNLNKIFKSQLVPARKPQYELLTKEMVDKLNQSSETRGQQKIQMPPFMRQWPTRERVLSVNSEIDGLLEPNTRLVVVDITYGAQNRKRNVVVRQPDGVLRTANWEEHTRFMQLYFPQNGRKLFRPRMFEPEYIEELLSKGKSSYLLDRACVQFEPDDPTYITMTHRVYEYINENSNHHDLRSTRHFGPMAFYLVWYKKVDKLLLDMLQRDLIEDARSLVELYHIVHRSCPSAELITNAMDNLEAIQIFSEHNIQIPNIGAIERALQTYKELMVDHGN